MKKLLSISLIIILTISVFQNTFATEYSEGYIEKLLDLNIGVEEYDLELAYIDNIYFSNPQTQVIFENFKVVNRVLKDAIIKKYRTGKIDYYAIKGIITNQKKFVYHTNRLFHYLSIKEQHPEYIDTDNFILKNYSNARIYYRKVRQLINK